MTEPLTAAGAMTAEHSEAVYAAACDALARHFDLDDLFATEIDEIGADFVESIFAAYVADQTAAQARGAAIDESVYAAAHDAIGRHFILDDLSATEIDDIAADIVASIIAALGSADAAQAGTGEGG